MVLILTLGSFLNIFVIFYLDYGEADCGLRGKILVLMFLILILAFFSSPTTVLILMLASSLLLNMWITWGYLGVTDRRVFFLRQLFAQEGNYFQLYTPPFVMIFLTSS